MAELFLAAALGAVGMLILMFLAEYLTVRRNNKKRGSR